MSDAFICDAVRTPIGRYGGALSTVRTDDLGAAPLQRALRALHDVRRHRTGHRDHFGTGVTATRAGDGPQRLAVSFQQVGHHARNACKLITAQRRAEWSFLWL